MYLPIMIDITDKKVIVVGGGRIAYRKIKTLVDYTLNIEIISPTINQKLQQLVKTSHIIWRTKHFEPQDISDAYLVIAATDDATVNDLVKQSLPANVLFNHTGQADAGNVMFPNTIRRDKLTISVATEGASPKLNQQIVKELEAMYPENYELFMQFLFKCRQMIKQMTLSDNDKQQLLAQITDPSYLDTHKQEQFLQWLNTTSSQND